MWKEFKRQINARPSERKTRDEKRPLTSKDFLRHDDDDLEAMEDLEEAYGKLSADINR